MFQSCKWWSSSWAMYIWKFEAFLCETHGGEKYMYIYHVELDELQHGLNNRWGHSKHEKNCTYNHNNKVSAPYNDLHRGTTSLWEFVVCPKPEFDELFKKECLYGEFPNCGVDKFKFCDAKYNGRKDWRIH